MSINTFPSIDLDLSPVNSSPCGVGGGGAMDGCSSWLQFHGGGSGDDGVASCERSWGSEPHQEQDTPISSQVEQELEEIYMLMGMEEHGHVAQVPSSSPPPPTFRSYSFPESPGETSSLVLAATSSNTTTGSYCHHRQQPAEVSSLQAVPLVAAYGERHRDTLIPNDTEEQQARRGGKGDGGRGGAFRPYLRNLVGPTKKLSNKPGGAGGQRAIKAAMAALARMHMARLAQWQCYRAEMAAAPPTVGSSNNGNQLQHVLSERKRREKLNDSFKALRAVLPPAKKKDKASILTRARDYLSTLNSRVSELEERNRMLAELLQRNEDGGDLDDDPGEKIEVDISRSEADEERLSQELHLKIVVRAGCNAMDAVFAIVQCLKEQGDVRLESMDTSSSSSGVPPGKAFQQTTSITLILKCSSCDDNYLKESVIKTIKGVMKSKTESA